MNKNQFVLISVLIVVISSCKNNSVDYPITYSSGLVTEHSIKIYTKDGEVTSSNVINSVLNRYQFNFSKIQDGQAGGRLVATYLSEDSVELTINNIKENKLRAVHEKNGLIYWEKQDTSYSGIGGFQIENLYKYHPFYYHEYRMVPPDGLYLINTKFKECYYIIKDGEKLRIPMIEFVWIHFGYNNGISFLGVNNSFYKEGLPDLFAKDTILVQQYSIEMN
jgi:hypothetical protein